MWVTWSDSVVFEQDDLGRRTPIPQVTVATLFLFSFVFLCGYAGGCKHGGSHDRCGGLCSVRCGSRAGSGEGLGLVNPHTYSCMEKLPPACRRCSDTCCLSFLSSPNIKHQPSLHTIDPSVLRRPYQVHIIHLSRGGTVKSWSGFMRWYHWW